MHRSQRPFAGSLWATALLLVAMAGPSYARGLSLYARALLDGERRSSVKISINISHSDLVFLRTDGAYQAKYQLYVRIIDPKGGDVLETAVVNETVVVEEYAQTRSRKRASSLSRSFDLPPGNYLVRCSIQIKDTHLVYSKETTVSVPNLVKAGVGLSKPRLFALPAGGAYPEDVLVRSRNQGQGREEEEQAMFAEFDRRPGFEFDVYLEREFGDSVWCELAYEVVDRDGSQVLYGRKKVLLVGSEARFMVPVNVDDWDAGTYKFQAKAELVSPPRATTSNLAFKLGFTRSMLTRHFARTVEIMALIANVEELKELKAAEESDRGRLWFEFWKRRDPSPGTEENEALTEHFRRLAHVAENFSSAGPGWRSDRGRIYIKHGEPDEVQVRSDPYLQGSYLIWKYYQNNITFVFHDRFGLGEYRLTQTSAF